MPSLLTTLDAEPQDRTRRDVTRHPPVLQLQPISMRDHSGLWLSALASPDHPAALPLLFLLLPLPLSFSRVTFPTIQR